MYRNIQCDNSTKLGSKWPIGFREEEVPEKKKEKKKDTMPFHTSMGILFLLCKKNPINSLEDHPMNIPVKFGSNWPSGIREENNTAVKFLKS